MKRTRAPWPGPPRTEQRDTDCGNLKGKARFRRDKIKASLAARPRTVARRTPESGTHQDCSDANTKSRETWHVWTKRATWQTTQPGLGNIKTHALSTLEPHPCMQSVEHHDKRTRSSPTKNTIALRSVAYSSLHDNTRAPHAMYAAFILQGRQGGGGGGGGCYVANTAPVLRIRCVPGTPSSSSHGSRPPVATAPSSTCRKSSPMNETWFLGNSTRGAAPPCPPSDKPQPPAEGVAAPSIHAKGCRPGRKGWPWPPRKGLWKVVAPACSRSAGSGGVLARILQRAGLVPVCPPMPFGTAFRGKSLPRKAVR